MSSKKYNVSVVIPTLGGVTLKNTIEHLNKGSCKPKEILVCMPEVNAVNLEQMEFDNVIVVKLNVRGQVEQRAAGFKHVKYEMVLQLDDDILLEENTLEILADNLKTLGPGCAVGPVYYDQNSNTCLHRFPSRVRGFIQNIYAYIICGAPWGKKRMGVLTSIGIGYGIDNTVLTDKLINVDWLPGGCVLMFQKNLIKDSFYPFKGKAYSEDILHSIIRKKNGITHHVATQAICKTRANPLLLQSDSVIMDIKARTYILKYTSGNKPHLWFWCCLDYFKRLVLHNISKLFTMKTT